VTERYPKKSDKRDFNLVFFLPTATTTRPKQPQEGVQEIVKFEKGGWISTFFLRLEAYCHFFVSLKVYA
jgi:hypothetical protein